MEKKLHTATLWCKELFRTILFETKAACVCMCFHTVLRQCSRESGASWECSNSRLYARSKCWRDDNCSTPVQSGGKATHQQTVRDRGIRSAATSEEPAAQSLL